MNRIGLGMIALAALAAAPAISLAADDASATQPTVAQLQEQLRQLQAKVEQLQGQQAQLNSKVVDETVQQVLRDSEKRSQFLQLEGMTAGWNNDQFFLSSADGNWSFIPHLMLQFRNVTSYNQADDDDLENGFEIRRLKLIFDGTAVSKDLFYHFQWNTSSVGSVALDDAYLRYTIPDTNGIQVKAGQYKDPWIKEENVGDHRQLAAERSMLNALLGGGGPALRVQGVSLIHEGKQYRAEFMYHDGATSLNTNFQDGGGPATFLGGGVGDNFGISGRVDWYFSEKSKEVDDFTALGNKQDLLVVGGGFDWTQAGDNNALFHTVDVQWENASGLGVYAAYVGVYRDLNTAATGGFPPADTFYDYGVLVQAGYVIPDTNWEPFARYDVTKLDEDSLPAGSEDTIHEITGGVNYYFYKHNAKLTVDATWLPNGSPSAQTGLGVLAGDDDEFILRAQVQLYL